MNNRADKRGRELFKKYRGILSIISKFYSCFPIWMRTRYLSRIRNKSGIIKIGIRYALLKTLAQRAGDNIRICENVFLYNIQNISFGSNVSIWPMTYIEGSGGVYIGDDVSIAHSVTIMSEEHNYMMKEIPIKEQGKSTAPVIIEDDVWIGAKATILSGTTIGKGSIVGAGAVVTKDVPKFSVVAGVPAKIIKQR